MFNKLWVSLLPFLQSVYALVSTLFCGNEHHNLIMICEKKYFLLFAMNLLPDNFSQCFLAFICDKENILCLCKVPGVSTLTRAGTALAGQVPSFYQWPSWEACLGVQSCTQPLCWNLQIRIVILLLVVQHGYLCTKNCPEPMNSFQEGYWKAVCWKILPALLIWIEIWLTAWWKIPYPNAVFYLPWKEDELFYS